MLVRMRSSAFELGDAYRRAGMLVCIVCVMVMPVERCAFVCRALHKVGGRANAVRVVMMRVCHGHLHAQADGQQYIRYVFSLSHPFFLPETGEISFP